jgi:uncharacterized protein DUF993
MRMTVDAPGGPLTIDDGQLDEHRVRLDELGDAPPTRRAYAATHVVMQTAYAERDHRLDRPGSADEIAEGIDWASTMRIRRHLDARGFGIAEAMDTAQRFFLGWPSAQRLIRECGALNLENGFIAGAGVDHLQAIDSTTQLVDGVVEQANFIQECGGSVILLPLAYLPHSGADRDSYVDVYTSIIDQLDGPVLLHWLGEMFAPQLAGYFPDDSFDVILDHDPDTVRGCKLSLLDDALELRVRRRISENDQVVFTGDDFNFARLILGGDPSAPPAVAPTIEGSTDFSGAPLPTGDFSHALLGIFDGISEPAGLALRLLAHGEVDRYMEIMAPCEELGRLVFESPTSHYKAGLAFISWLNGWQDNTMLVNREELARSGEHYWQVARGAAAAGALIDAELAAERLRGLAQ